MKNSGFILDASVTLAWCFHDEATAITSELLENLSSDYAIVPQLWSLEIGNILALAEQKKRISAEQSATFITELSKLDIQVDHETFDRGFGDILTLAKINRITTYDAAYLELALRYQLPLASKDEQLCKSARKHGIPILGAKH